MAGDLQRIEGLDEFLRDLRALPGKLRQRVIRNSLSAGARMVRDAAKQAAPRLDVTKPQSQAALRRGHRAVGTVRQAIRVRTSKAAKRAGNIGVFVNVRPARRGDRGSRNPRDPFYWRFLQFGWHPRGPGNAQQARAHRRAVRDRTHTGRRVPGVNFLGAGAAKLGAALARIRTELQPQLQRLLDSGKARG